MVRLALAKTRGRGWFWSLCWLKLISRSLGLAYDHLGLTARLTNILNPNLDPEIYCIGSKYIRKTCVVWDQCFSDWNEKIDVIKPLHRFCVFFSHVHPMTQLKQVCQHYLTCSYVIHSISLCAGRPFSMTIPCNVIMSARVCTCLVGLTKIPTTYITWSL